MVESNKKESQEEMLKQIAEIQKQLEDNPDKDPMEMINQKMATLNLDLYQKELVKRLAT